MQRINRLGKPINVLTVLAIATTGMSTPAIAGTDITSDRGNLKLAQIVGQCRAAKQQIPVFRSADATSEALRLISTDDQVTLASNAVDANGFISVSAPVSGFVHAINLKSCSGNGGNPPPTKDLCRRVIRPAEGLIIRRDATSTSAQVGGVSYLERVSLTTAPPTVKRAENRDWVEISAPARGWVSNGLVTEARSNLAYCQ